MGAFAFEYAGLKGSFHGENPVSGSSGMILCGHPRKKAVYSSEMARRIQSVVTVKFGTVLA